MQSLTRVAVAAALCVLPAFAGRNLQGNGKNLFWKEGKVTLRVSRSVHWAGGETGVDRREVAGSVHAAVFEAIRSWVRPGRANVELDLDFTDTQTVSAGENVVTFTDPAPFDTGVCDKAQFITCTLLTFTEDGAIANAAVAFNPYKRHSSVGLDGTHDIGLIMMHEMGHVLGLDHSFVADSVMRAAVEQEPAAGAPRMYSVRGLSEDDLSSLAALYALAPLSAITGAVKRSDGPVAGVRVMAIDAAGRVPHGALSAEDGSYRLTVGPGDYTVIAEPADGPAAVAVGQIKVQEGLVTEGVDVAVTRDAKLAVESVGVVLNGSYAGMPRVDLARGRDHSLALVRSPAGLEVEVMLPEPMVARTGVASSPASAPQLVRQAVKVMANAPAGSYALAVRAGLTFTMLPASLRVVPNPEIVAIKDAETGEVTTVLRPGRRYAITGTDLAGSEAVATAEFEGAPATAQLAGVAVRIADRFVPIISAKPGELVFQLPAVVEAGEVKLTVVAGTLMESGPFTVRLALE